MISLLSCDNCGVVLDAKKLPFAEDIYEDDGSVNERLASWNQKEREFQAFVPCPVCKEEVFKPN